MHECGHGGMKLIQPPKTKNTIKKHQKYMRLKEIIKLYAQNNMLTILTSIVNIIWRAYVAKF